MGLIRIFRCYSVGIRRFFDPYFHTFRNVYNSYWGFYDIMWFLFHVSWVMCWCLNKGYLLSGLGHIYNKQTKVKTGFFCPLVTGRGYLGGYLQWAEHILWTQVSLAIKVIKIHKIFAALKLSFSMKLVHLDEICCKFELLHKVGHI